ncbi:hypothetical protein PILCRDRAFT_91045 [Piloderma croceum F 1598]|uniref:Uncharacterized protein n=1 Tax=Piloderma croceum (strain F 1598) TaxID=765440 RepID=A0A0C3FCT2_PILCF|nr:hypothetical protein PILCRDRAFT_91045 [Piloderma croceum F 1598]
MSGLPPATPLSASSLTFVHENPIPRALQHTPSIQTAPVYPAANPQPSPIQPKTFYTTSKTSEATKKTTPFTGKELFELIQAAIAVRFFKAKHGEKGHKGLETAPEHIIKAVEGSSYEGALGAPLYLLLSSKKKFKDLSDKKVKKLHKKVDEDKRGGEAIQNASLHCSHHHAQANSNSDLDDDAHALPTSTTPAETQKAIPVKRLIIRSESSATKKKHSNADVNDGQPSTHNTKCIKRADSNINLHNFLLEEREKCEEFQGLMLLQMKKGNSQFERSLKNTQNFQNDFLAILACALIKLPDPLGVQTSLKWAIQMSNYTIWEHRSMKFEGMEFLVTIICLTLEPCRMCYPPYGAVNETKDGLDQCTTLVNSISILGKFRWVKQVVLITVKQVLQYFVKI